MSRKITKSLNENSDNNLIDVELPSKDYNILATDYNSIILRGKSPQYGDQQSTYDKDVDYTQTVLYNAFRPLMISLRLVGMHHTRRMNHTGQYCAVPTVSQIYSWFLTIIAWVMTIKVGAALRLVSSPGPYMLNNLTSLTWAALCALNATCFIIASHKPESIKEYFVGFIKLNKFGGSYVCPKKIQKYILAGTIATWIIVIINITVFGYLINTTQLFDILATDPFPAVAGTTSYWIMKIYYTIIGFFFSAFWVFPSTMQLSACLIIHQELKLFCTSLGSKINSDGVFIGHSLEPERRRFLQIVKIIESADNCLSLHQSAAFACNITNICLILYTILYYSIYNSVPAAMGAMVFWLFYAVADICVVIASGVLINSEVSI